MGTHGLYGFFRGGVTKATYRYEDSGPNELGKNIIEFIKETSVTEMNHIFDKIILVQPYETPSKECQKEYAEYLNLLVDDHSPNSWYCLLRKSQGKLHLFKKNLLHMIDNAHFISEHSCEYAYIINLTDLVLEVYFYPSAHSKEQNRCPQTEKEAQNDYGDKLVVKHALNAIPESWEKLIPEQNNA